MKKIKYFVLVILSIITASCDDFLNVKSISTDNLVSVFESEKDAQAFVSGVYQPFMEEYTNAMSMYANPSSDVEMVSVGATPDGGRRDGASCETTPANSAVVSSSYNNAYVAINRANIAIEGIVNSTMYNEGNETMYQLLGEVITIRAYWYSELVKHFGDVPFKTSATKAGDDYYLPRTDRDSILTFVINDMIEIEPKMKWANELAYGVEQVSREFTQALIARVALARGGYSLRKGTTNNDMTMQRSTDWKDYIAIANTYSKKVIESNTHKLALSYSTVFTNQSKLIVESNDDMIFEIAYGPGRSEVGYVPGKRIDGGTHQWGGGGGYYTLAPTYIYSFDTLDNRLFTNKEEASVATYTKITNELKESILNVQDAQVSKWCKYWMTTPMGPQSSKGTSINWPVMRYADVLLMYAETENELNNGPTTAAQEALKTVRRRAFAQQNWNEKVDGYVSAISANKETFFNAIVNERAWELGGELLRPFDLVRWNLFKTKIREARNTAVQMSIDINAGTGKYANLPAVIYYKQDAATGKIDIKGLYSKLETAPDGYTAKNWLGSIAQDSTLTNQWFYYNWRGVLKDLSKEANYLLPIPATAIIESKGKLSNVGYGWND